MNKNNFYFNVFKKLFGRINRHQLLNEHVLHNVFAFYQLLIVKKLKTLQQNWKEEEMHFLLGSFHYAINCSMWQHYNSFRIVITYKTRNIRSLFYLKNKNDYKSCVFYKGDCSCDSCYIGETKRNAEVRWNDK